jgi:hypothetical protein
MYCGTEPVRLDYRGSDLRVECSMGYAERMPVCVHGGNLRRRVPARRGRMRRRYAEHRASNVWERRRVECCVGLHVRLPRGRVRRRVLAGRPALQRRATRAVRRWRVGERRPSVQRLGAVRTEPRGLRNVRSLRLFRPVGRVAARRRGRAANGCRSRRERQRLRSRRYLSGRVYRS